MASGTADSILADLYAYFSMWWAQRTERRLALRRYRLELRGARRLWTANGPSRRLAVKCRIGNHGAASSRWGSSPETSLRKAEPRVVSTGSGARRRPEASHPWRRLCECLPGRQTKTAAGPSEMLPRAASAPPNSYGADA